MLATRVGFQEQAVGSARLAMHYLHGSFCSGLSSVAVLSLHRQQFLYQVLFVDDSR